MLARYMLLLYVRLSFTNRYYTKTAQHTIIETMQHDSPETSFMMQKISVKFRWGEPKQGHVMQVG